MIDNSLILAYLAVLVSYLVFGIGLLPLADNRPPHIKRIVDRYSLISQQTKKWLVIYLLLGQITAHILYLLDINAICGCQSFDVVRLFFIRYYNQITAVMILISSGLIVWLYHQTAFLGKDYQSLLEKILANKKTPYELKLQDLKEIGFFADSIDQRLEAMRKARSVARSNFPDTVPRLLDVIKAILENQGSRQSTLFEEAIVIITDITKLLGEPSAFENNLPVSIDMAPRLLGMALKDIGSEALSQAASWDAINLKRLLLEAINVMPAGQQAEMFYAFGVAAQQGGHRDEALEFLSMLVDQNPPEWRIYWPGLLARLAADTDVGYQWAAQMAQGRKFAYVDLEEARHSFTALDMVTAQAIAEVQANM